MMLTGGILMLVETMRHAGWKDRIWPLLIAVLYIVTALWCSPIRSRRWWRSPCLWPSLLISGALRLFLAFKIRPASAWIWMLVGGIVSMCSAA